MRTAAPAATEDPAAPDKAPKPKTLTLNFGPQHPATHGTLRLVLDIEGETIVRCRPEIGFLHTGFEKLGETLNYNKFVTLSDRMNYLSPLANNIGYVLAVEKFLGVQITPRCTYFRVILAELSRIADHALSVGLAAMDVGAFTAMLYAFRDREKLYDVFEYTTGARLTTSFTRVGGMARDVPQGFDTLVTTFLEGLTKTLDDVQGLLDKNRIWHQRTRGVGKLSREDAVAYGVTGPLLRASGMKWDLRRARPYLCYPDLEFDIPTDTACDTEARYRVRLAEIRESAKIVRQAMARLPAGEMNVQDPKIFLPKKEVVYKNMEALIYHFKLIMEGHGLRPPVGQIYEATESPNGELGFHLVSDGTDKPWRLRVRPPSFINYTAFPKMVEGQTISDAVATLGSLNIIAGELDR